MTKGFTELIQEDPLPYGICYFADKIPITIHNLGQRTTTMQKQLSS